MTINQMILVMIKQHWAFYDNPNQKPDHFLNIKTVQAQMCNRNDLKLSGSFLIKLNSPGVLDILNKNR